MSSTWVIALVVPKRQTLKQILDTDLLKTVWRLVTWNPTKGAEPFQWWPDAFWLWLFGVAEIFMFCQYHCELKRTAITLMFALFGSQTFVIVWQIQEQRKRSTRSIGIPGQLSSCGQGFLGKHFVQCNVVISDSAVCVVLVVLVDCVLSSGVSEMFGQGRLAFLAELPTLCTFISV